MESLSGTLVVVRLSAAKESDLLVNELDPKLLEFH
jgi:hypothetical protein